MRSLWAFQKFREVRGGFRRTTGWNGPGAQGNLASDLDLPGQLSRSRWCGKDKGHTDSFYEIRSSSNEIHGTS